MSIDMVYNCTHLFQLLQPSLHATVMCTEGYSSFTKKKCEKVNVPRKKLCWLIIWTTSYNNCSTKVFSRSSEIGSHISKQIWKMIICYRITTTKPKCTTKPTMAILQLLQCCTSDIHCTLTKLFYGTAEKLSEVLSAWLSLRWKLSLPNQYVPKSKQT